MQGTDSVREEVEAFYKACHLPDVPDDVDEFDDEGFEDDAFYEWLTVKSSRVESTVKVSQYFCIKYL